MTRFFLNETEIPPPPPGISSLDGILRHVERNYLSPDSVVRQVRIDDLPVLTAEMTEPLPDTLEGIEKRGKVEIVTGSLRDVALESTREATAYIDRVETVIPSLVMSFQTGPGPDAFENLREIHTGFYWLNLLLDRLCTSLRIPVSEISPQGDSFPEHRGKSVEVLQQLIGAQETKDFELVADLLEYRILPLLSAWRGFLSSVSWRIEIASTS